MKSQNIEIPKETPGAVRRGEGLMIVVQDNATRALKIERINDVLEHMLGYAMGESLREPFFNIFGKDVAKTLAEDIEFETGAADFGDVFARIRDVKLRRRLGEEIRLPVTLSRLLSEGGQARFQLVVPNEMERASVSQFRDFIQRNLEGRSEIDPASGLPNRATAKAFLPTLKHYYADGNVGIVFAVIRIDRFNKSIARYGAEPCQQLLTHVHNCCKITFRNEDLIFALSDRSLAVVLFDISRESARVVFNRLRWRIRNHRITFGGKASFSISTCIGFDMLDLEQVDEVFDRCENAVHTLDDNERNALVEFGA
jgi:diguanylate cyclase (GGDEF)-like protein